MLNSETNALENAPILPQSFPVIFFPESPHLNNIMAEALASHGYIVVSPSRFGTTSSDYEWQQVRGMETRIQDYQYALAHIKDLFNIQNPRIAVMGIGMNASDGLLWMMRDSSIGCLVSLEGGVLTRFEFDMIKHSLYYNIRKLNKPLLLFHSPHEHVNPELSNSYKYCDRYLFHLPQLTEFYYLNYGVWESSFPGLLGNPPGNTNTSVQYVFNHTVNFLNAVLYERPDVLKQFQSQGSNKTYDTSLITRSIKLKKPIPPAQEELENMLQNKLPLVEVVSRYLEDDHEAFPYSVFLSLGTRMIQNALFEQCISWGRLSQKSYLQAAYGYTLMARGYLELKKPY